MKRRHPITYAQMLKQFQQDTNFTMYDGYFSNIKKDMAEIKATYTPRQIRKSKFNFDSLVFEMALCGHCSEEIGDDCDCYYMAGSIVLLQHHVFSEDKHLRLLVYSVMRELKIHLDKKMCRDFHKHLLNYYNRRVI